LLYHSVHCNLNLEALGLFECWGGGKVAGVWTQCFTLTE
jgi:hypothetical protein